MLKTIENTGSAANPEETKGGDGGNSVVGDVVSGGEATIPIKRKNPVKTTKSKILLKSKNHDFPKFRPEETGAGFLTPEARLAFTSIKASVCQSPNSSPFRSRMSHPD